MKITKILFILSLFYTSHCLAMFCPNNFNNIEIGDSIDKVKAQCGNPDSQKTFTKGPEVPQEWTYYIAVPNNLYSMDSINQGSIRVTFAFDHDKVINMTTNGAGTYATTICNNINLEYGSTIKDVEAACGKPAMITKTNTNVIATQEGDEDSETINITEFSYSGANAATLVFENGKLTARK